MTNKKPVVGILMGSDSDMPVMENTTKTLKDFDIPYEISVLSAHRAPEKVALYAAAAVSNGLKVLIAAAGGAAHLAGAVAANTTLPVIGVPIDATSLNGMDALLATVQMPPGVPVATVAIGKFGATNAAVLAAQILALSDAALREKLLAHKKAMQKKVEDANAKLKSSHGENS